MLLYWILLPIVWVLAHILFRFEVIGRENLKAVRDGRAYVIAPNHIANLDPVLIAITIFDWKRLRILAKEELFKNPLAGWFLRCMGAVSIERGKGDTTTVEKLTNECKNGTGIMIFPEGTRTKTGKLGVIKSGAFVIAAASGADMLPWLLTLLLKFHCKLYMNQRTFGIPMLTTNKTAYQRGIF